MICPDIILGKIRFPEKNKLSCLNVVQVLIVLSLSKVYLSLLGGVVDRSHAGVGGDVVSQHMWC